MDINRSIINNEFIYKRIPRVLSIQSHVVSGYVGNRAAVFPLQLLGFETDFINSVQFSNHTGYSSFQGQVLKGHELDSLIEGLVNCELQNYDYILTGYIGSESFLTSVLTTVESIKNANPECLFVCDPVLGDDGKYYVPDALVQIYREDVIPKADIITPNQFEAELLSGRKIYTRNDAIEVMKILMDMGPFVVILTSCEVTEHPGQLLCMSLTKNRISNTIQLSSVIVEKLDGRFTGTGDVTAALLLGIGHKYNIFNDMPSTLSRAIGTIHRIINITSIKQNAELSDSDKDLIKNGKLLTDTSLKYRYMRSAELSQLVLSM